MTIGNIRGAAQVNGRPILNTAVQIPDEVFARLKINPHAFHGDWNYTIAPRR